jgi:hypothetical protein
MATCSLAQFAERHGASKQAATKWKSRGVLVFSGDQVDIEKSDRRMRGAGLGRFKQASTAQVPVDPKVNQVDRKRAKVSRRIAPVDDDDQEEAEDDLDGELIGDFLGDIDRGRYTTQSNAQRIKENALAARQLLNLRKDAGELIEIERAGEIWFELSRQQRDSWITWPVKIGPLLAAELGVETTRLVEALTNHVQEQLEAIGGPEPDYTEQ